MYKQLRHRLKHRKRTVSRLFPVKDEYPLMNAQSLLMTNNVLEIDTIVGKKHKTAIVTIVERTSAFFMMSKRENGKQAKGLAKTVTQMLLPYKKNILSITSDNGVSL